MSDVAEQVGLAMPEMPTEAQARLRTLVSFCAPRNPVDATAQVSQRSEADGARSSNCWCAMAAIPRFWGSSAMVASLAPVAGHAETLNAVRER